MSRALRYNLLSAACCLLRRPAERLGGLLAETSAISAGKFSEIAESAFESDRSHCFPGERGLQHAVSALQSAVAQKPLRGCPKMATKASLEMADAHPERCSNVGDPDRIAGAGADQLAGAPYQIRAKILTTA